MSEIPRNRKTDNQFTASLGSNASFMGYMGSYKRAFDALMEQVHSSGHSVDLLAYPILFIARHCLELGFKTNIRYFAQYSERDDHIKSGSHDLRDLFTAFKLHVNSAIKNIEARVGSPVDKETIQEFKNYCKKVEKLTSVFQPLDQHSDRFRYPVNKQNQEHVEPEATINLLDVQELIEESMVLLAYTAAVFGRYTDVLDTIDDAYEQTMREQYL